MNDSVFELMNCHAETLGITAYMEDFPQYVNEHNLDEGTLDELEKVFAHIANRKNASVVNTLLRMSRLPQKSPKTFQNFDFSRLHGKQIEHLKNLPTLSALYAHKNLAFIGPQGVGKTHLAMAFGYECCMRGMKTYFMKATELNQKFTDARKYGRVGSAVNFLVKPSCLIIDEIGRCVFDKENTRLFFDLIDRRYSKEGTNCMILTSNKQPDAWGEFFAEDDTLLCSLDRFFDEASVFVIKGDSFRGKNLETIHLETGQQMNSIMK